MLTMPAAGSAKATQTDATTNPSQRLLSLDLRAASAKQAPASSAIALSKGALKELP